MAPLSGPPDPPQDDAESIGSSVVSGVQRSLLAAMAGTDSVEASALHDSLGALIERIHALGWPPERSVAFVKRILRDSNVRPSPSAIAEASPGDRATVVYQRTILISIEAYYRLAGVPGPIAKARPVDA